jgi:succinyl-CoA synthetase beta subunit
MARLHEYQGKAILAANGFKIPRGRAASTADEAVAVAKELAGGKIGSEVVVKIQAWTGAEEYVEGINKRRKRKWLTKKY